MPSLPPRRRLPPVAPKTPEVRFLQRFFHTVLLLMLAGTATLAVLSAFGYATDLWDVYADVYVGMLLFYTWFIFVLLLWHDVRPRSYRRYRGEKIAVIVPCYNESPALLRRSVESVLAARGEKEIYVVDDGSTNGGRRELRALAAEYGLKIHCFRRNKGKREALYHAVTKMMSECDFVVTIDSDTVLHRDALVKVVEPLKDPRIGASTGDVQLLNEKQNWLTRMIGAYYWIGLHIYKRAQSSMGMVVCCSGCLAAYRSDILRENIRDFVRQEFFGERCTHSEDRHLTNLVLQRGYDVVYVETAISYTETPATIRGFLRQQQRWKRGYTRESLYTLSYAWRNRPLLFLQILGWDLTIPFFSFGLMLGLAGTILSDPAFFLTVMIPSWAVSMIIRNLPIVFYGRDKIGGLLVYMFFYEFCLYWQSVYALFTMKNKSWITR